ncbi:L-galactose dehydrogenase [Morella rubra]|uniref:L-galactose dehydrogenase n=1 Tax=Morella rubra TaxID=262757 RepID=A0A6A1WGB5_9ROSI|nr:L-galactose dehydrogenase [Morella rubra]
MVLEFSSNGAVHETFRLGINFFDTSPYYGGTLSEKVLGKALKALGAPRQDYIVSTKCGRYIEGFDFSAERVTRSIDESLARLQLDYVDILQCHDIEFGSLDQVVNETIPALQKLKEAGKIRFIGVIGLPLEVFTRARMAKEVAKFSSYVRQLVMQKAELIHQLKSQEIGDRKTGFIKAAATYEPFITSIEDSV